jgi:hypothetical protein
MWEAVVEYRERSRTRAFHILMEAYPAFLK